MFQNAGILLELNDPPSGDAGGKYMEIKTNRVRPTLRYSLPDYGRLHYHKQRYFNLSKQRSMGDEWIHL